jgi:hypothetical protein
VEADYPNQLESQIDLGDGSASLLLSSKAFGANDRKNQSRIQAKLQKEVFLA